MKPEIRIFPDPFGLAEKFAGELVALISEAALKKHSFTIALSGGSTPDLLYSVLGDHFSTAVTWDHVHLFWGDERCVPPDSPESNYGMTLRALIRKIRIPLSNVHRVHGETEPVIAATAYSEEIEKHTSSRNGLPRFDLVLLGLGDDGHTASIFPGQDSLLLSDQICSVAVHPGSGQKRITLTGRVLNNAAAVVFLATGSKKAGIVSKILNSTPDSLNFPASGIAPEDGRLVWLLDRAAASGL